jgi:hypothetical protein
MVMLGMRSLARLALWSLIPLLLCVDGCSRGDGSATSMFNGQWMGWLLPSQPNTFNLTWYVWSSKGVVVMTGGKRIKFGIAQETSDTDGKKGLILQTERGTWSIVFSKDGESLGVHDSAGQLIGGFQYVSDTGSLQPDDFLPGK